MDIGSVKWGIRQHTGLIHHGMSLASQRRDIKDPRPFGKITSGAAKRNVKARFRHHRAKETAESVGSAEISIRSRLDDLEEKFQLEAMTSSEIEQPSYTQPEFWPSETVAGGPSVNPTALRPNLSRSLTDTWPSRQLRQADSFATNSDPGSPLCAPACSNWIGFEDFEAAWNASPPERERHSISSSATAMSLPTEVVYYLTYFVFYQRNSSMLTGESQQATSVFLPPNQTTRTITMLQLAVEYQRCDIVKALLETGAGTCSQNSQGQSCLHIASRQGTKDIVEALLKWQTRLDQVDFRGYTALHYGAEENHAHVVTALLERGADGKLQNWDGQTALHLAASQGHERVVASIAQVTPDSVHIKDINGRTALALAIERGQLMAVRALLESGADPNAAV
ncbi:hypothetical protein NLG97_g338 [Lecanicillium saksenae]|uniref:Uncharacterized protein n=1 Tax=Lecanicillium saksenae TaxID=468837 RepID=A0ACC1RAB7_9HYPO|nr:hypothetical protein NLG97_g338 [Lecanicillium saksenae]